MPGAATVYVTASCEITVHLLQQHWIWFQGVSPSPWHGSNDMCNKTSVTLLVTVR